MNTNHCNNAAHSNDHPTEMPLDYKSALVCLGPCSDNRNIRQHQRGSPNDKDASDVSVNIDIVCGRLGSGIWENAPETVHLLSSPFVFWTPHTGACCAVSGACCLKFQRPGPQPTMPHAMFLALSPADTARTVLPENKQKPRTV